MEERRGKRDKSFTSSPPSALKMKKRGRGRQLFFPGPRSTPETFVGGGRSRGEKEVAVSSANRHEKRVRGADSSELLKSLRRGTGGRKKKRKGPATVVSKIRLREGKKKKKGRAAYYIHKTVRRVRSKKRKDKEGIKRERGRGLVSLLTYFPC